MTAHIYTEADAPIDPLKGKRIAVIGYGSQGHAHALNAHDSGLDVMVGLYKGSKSWEAAEKAGLQVAEVADATRQADVRSEEHTSELQSLAYLVCRLLLEKKKRKIGTALCEKNKINHHDIG